MTTDNIKPKGGRGKRADYVTVQVRCPEPIKAAVINLINQWHLGETTPQTNQLDELQAEIIRLTQLNENLNTAIIKPLTEAIEELKKQNNELDDENLKLHEKTGDLGLEIQILKSELSECKQNLNTSKQTTQQLNLNTSIISEARDILENALTLKANAGGKIKDAIREALELLK